MQRLILARTRLNALFAEETSSNGIAPHAPESDGGRTGSGIKFWVRGCFQRVRSSFQGILPRDSGETAAERELDDNDVVTKLTSLAAASSHEDHGDDEHSHRSRLMAEMLGIRRYLFEKLHLTNFGRDENDARHLPKVLDTVDFCGVMKHWNEGKFKKIVTMVGAGISTCEYLS